MLTLKTETVEDIQEALQLLGRLPRKQRVRVLSEAKSKLLAIARSRGNNPEIQQLRLDVARAYAAEKRRLDKRPSVKVVNKSIYDLEEGEITPVRDEGRYEGLQVGRDRQGFYAVGPGGRTDSVAWSGHITDEELERIAGTDNPS